MTFAVRLVVSIVFSGMAAFLVVYTWVPARGSLQVDASRVTRIAAQPNTWYEVDITTESGQRLTCRGRYGWPLLGPARCPIERFQPLLGQSVTVAHDGRRAHEVLAGTQTVVSLAAGRQARAVAVALAGLMLLMAAWVWRRH